MICPTCSAENTPGAKFCNECGTALASGCPNCGATNKPGARFCNECGAALDSNTVVAEGAPAPRGPVAERRVVSVVFADIVGFTPFAAERDAEDVRETLTRYFELCSDIVGRYGGTVEKFIGDAVMAVWGAPVAHEDDAERAVRAALEIVGSVSTLGSDVQARAGVLTGEAAVTIGAVNQGLVAGDLVNTASRLQSAAPPGSVLVGESTMRASSNAVAYEPAGDQSLKGKVTPVAAWRALRVVAERGGRNRSSRLEAPFVGRGDELRLLKDLFHATGREQKARLVSVIGPAGIGKSRLAWEFLKYVDGLVETTWWHDGRSPAYGEGISFWALGEMIRGRCGLVETDDEATTRAKVSETVAQWVPDVEERAWIERALLALLGIEAGLSPDELFPAWRTFFERISEQGTVTLVFEDMHFADTGLLDFVDHLLEWSRGHAIYVVTLSRPELLERRTDWGTAKRSFTSIFVEPLDDAHMVELLAGLVPGLPDAAVRTIVGRAEGVPLYAVETVRMLVAEGRLTERDGRYVPVGDLASVAVPETLTALIRSRLDALDQADRELVHDAAVLGQSFSVEALSAVSGADPAAVEIRLRGLGRRELLRQQVDPRSPERGYYVFVQALIREVAYNTLSKPDRKVRHLAAARHFEQSGSDELAGVLAGHYVAAYETAAAGSEADALAAQARVALRAAAERAAALGSFDLAQRFVEQALSITSEPGDGAQLHEQAGHMALGAGHLDDAAEHQADAGAIYQSLGDRAAVARTIASRAEAMLEGRRSQIALEIVEPADREYGDVLAGEVAARLKFVLARALEQASRFPAALAAADLGLEVAEHEGLLKMNAQLLITKGLSMSGLNRLREGVALIRGAADIARANGWDDVLAGALTVESAMVGETEPRRGWSAALEAAEIARRTGRRDRLMMAVGNVGYSAFIVGEWDTGLGQIDPLASDTDVAPGQRVWLISNSIILHANRGDDVEAALAEMDALVVASGEHELRQAASDAHANRDMANGEFESAAQIWRGLARESASMGPWGFYQAARMSLWRRNIDEVRADIEAVNGSGVHGPTVAARVLTMAAGVAGLEGRTAESVGLYRSALDSWRSLGTAWDEALTGLDMTIVLPPALPEVAAVAASTRAIFERLGARPYLERLDSTLARGANAPTVREQQEPQAKALAKA